MFLSIMLKLTRTDVIAPKIVKTIIADVVKLMAYVLQFVDVRHAKIKKSS